MVSTNATHVFPPGEFLREELEARGWSQVDLAEILGRPAKLVNDIIAAKRAITPETAQGLAEALGTSPELWMNLEAQYQLHRAKPSDDAVSRRAKLFEVAPVKEMQRRGWVAETKDVARLESSLCQFFRVSSIDDISALPHAAKKSTSYMEDVSAAQRAWIRRVKTLAESIDVPAAFSGGKSFYVAIDKLKALLRDRAEARHVPRVLAEAGIRFMVVEHLAGTKIDGVCLWMDEDRPVIALSLRFDRIDSFWFALGHELGHVYRRDGVDSPVVLDVDLVGEGAAASADKPEAERAADNFSAALLIPPDELNGFMARVKPLYSKDNIKGFAARIKVHPGIVVGQLAFRKQIGYSHSREMLERVRDVVTATALTDGWGHSVA
jgi:HTH-type transcriptional regulator / antitoxin HigA